MAMQKFKINEFENKHTRSADELFLHTVVAIGKVKKIILKN